MNLLLSEVTKDGVSLYCPVNVISLSFNWEMNDGDSVRCVKEGPVHVTRLSQF